MPIAGPMTGPLYPSSVASSTSSLIPRVFECAIKGRPYMLDLQSEQFAHETIPFLKQQADPSSSPAEASVNPDDLWRRAQDSWHVGAGQVYRDKPDGEPVRFRSSKGIDPWTRYQFTLLPEAQTKINEASSTNIDLTVAGDYLYWIAGGSIRYTQDITPNTPTATNITGEPGTAPLYGGITSDGFHIWTAHGTDGVYQTTRGAGSTASYATGTVKGPIEYVKGRLMAANDNSIYNITAAGALPAALFTHANTDFAWVGFAEGQASIYAAGFSGDKSLIYRITIKQDASALDQPIVAGQLPDGEIIRSIYGYIGYVLIGTDLGWRFAIADQQGNLQIGPLVRTANSVLCFEGQDRFCWFGWTNYDSTSTGLGRLDVTAFSQATPTPAYASDLMVDEPGTVKKVVTFQDLRVFAYTTGTTGVIAAETANKVATGTIDSGDIGYGLPDNKILLGVDVRTQPLDGSYVSWVNYNDGSFFQVSEQLGQDSTGTYQAVEYTGDRFELRLVLSRSASDATMAPQVVRWTLFAEPSATGPGGTTGTRSYITVPLLLHDVDKVKGRAYKYDVASEVALLEDLRNSQTLVPLQLGDATYSVVLADYQWKIYDQTSDNSSFNGTFICRFKRLG